MGAAEDSVQGMIANAKSNADAALGSAITYAGTAQTLAAGYGFLGPNPVVVPDNFSVPAYVPNINLATTFNSDFNTTWAGMETWVRGLMGDYVNTYFPILDPAIQTTQNAWLLNVVNNGYQGIPTAIEQAMWDRARAKDTLEALRMEDEATTQFSARGFSLPSGVLANRLQTVQQAAADKASTIARDLAIKQTEIAVEMTKFSIEEMTKLRLGIADALAKFMSAWMELPKAAAEVAKAKAEMNRLLWDSSSNYIHALVAKAGLKVDADKAVLDAKVASDRIFVENTLGAQGLRINAALKAAEELGAVAAAYASSMTTLSNVGAITNTNM